MMVILILFAFCLAAIISVAIMAILNMITRWNEHKILRAEYEKLPSLKFYKSFYISSADGNISVFNDGNLCVCGIYLWHSLILKITDPLNWYWHNKFTRWIKKIPAEQTVYELEEHLNWLAEKLKSKEANDKVNPSAN